MWIRVVNAHVLYCILSEGLVFLLKYLVLPGCLSDMLMKFIVSESQATNFPPCSPDSNSNKYIAWLYYKKLCRLCCISTAKQNLVVPSVSLVMTFSVLLWLLGCSKESWLWSFLKWCLLCQTGKGMCNQRTVVIFGWRPNNLEKFIRNFEFFTPSFLVEWDQWSKFFLVIRILYYGRFKMMKTHFM